MGTDAGAEDIAWVHLRAGEWDAARRGFLRLLADEPEGLVWEGLAQALWWLDDGAGCLDAEESAYRLHRDAGDDRAAARAATCLGYDALLFGEGETVAHGWREQAATLLAGLPEGVEHGWLAVREAETILATHGEPALAGKAAERAAILAERLDDANLTHVAMALRGLAATAAGSPATGVPLLDRAVTAATIGDVTDVMWMGKIYCWLIIACQQTRDLSRADEWCRRVEQLCQRRQLTPLFTACRIQHCSVLIERGAWSEAESTLQGVVDTSAGSRRHSRLDAVVLLGEIRRRQGRLDEGEQLLQQAEFEPAAIVSRALIRLATGMPGEAWSAMSGVLASTLPDDRTRRATFLLPAVRIAVAVGDVRTAHALATELQELAASVGNRPLLGSAAAARATVLTVEQPADGQAAAVEWGQAVKWFHEAALPFDEAESRVGLALALRLTGADASADEHLVKAQTLLQDLGATVRCTQIQELRHLPPTLGRGVLTDREQEVLRLVADGFTTGQIATALTVSPHTVHRHVANILTKLDQPNRTAAVAHAIAHHLL